MNRGQSLKAYQSALRHMQAGRHAEAQKSCREALQAEPNHADALHLMGALSVRESRPDAAIEWICQAIRQDPKPIYICNLGSILQSQRRFDEALQAFDKAVQLNPGDAPTWKKLAGVLADLKRAEEAALCYQRVLTLDVRDWDAAYRAGQQLHAAGKFEEALASLDLAHELDPKQAVVLKMRADTLCRLQRFEAALDDNRRANVLDPDNADTCNNIGACLQALGRETEALEWFDRADAILPDTVEILNNRAFLLGQLQRFDEAFALYDRMKAAGLNNAVTDWNRSLIALLTGDFEPGWIGREARWRKTNPVFYPVFDQPMWRGQEPVEGKTVLVHVDEGLGDTIQFARYLPMLAARGARIVLVVEHQAQRLLAGLSGVSECLAFPADPPPAFDLHCAIGSLPLAFGTRLDTVPAATAYLPSPPEAEIEAWDIRLGPRDRLRIGLVWSGNPNHPNDRNRSMPLRTMSGLLAFDARFVSLQKNPKPDDKALLAGLDILDATEHLHDLADTAALIACLDLVITVDTGVAHLAAALGRPTWILLPHTPDYRWLLGRDDSPWYPTARLFRKSPTGDYDQVIRHVMDELQRFAAEQPRPAASAAG